MIRSNREIVRDRHLFNNLHKHSHISQLICQPYIQPHSNTTHNAPAQHFMESFMGVIEDFMGRVMSRLEGLQRRMDGIVRGMEKIENKVRSRRNARLYSFANSPSSKKQAPDDQPSTQPKTKYKHKYQSASSSPTYMGKNDETFLGVNMQQLHSQIKQLKRYIDIAHVSGPKSPTQNSKAQADLYQKSVSKIREELDSRPMYMNSSADLQRYKAVISQYRRQEQLLEDRVDRYRQGLREVLGWLRNLREVGLSGYLPCEACKIRSIVQEYLNTPPTNKTTNRDINRPTIRPTIRPTTLYPSTKNKDPQQSQYYYEGQGQEQQQYDQQMKGSQYNEKLSDRDSLLMEYDGEESLGDI